MRKHFEVSRKNTPIRQEARKAAPRRIFHFSDSRFSELIESRDIAQMGIVSKEIVQFCFSLVCYALFGLDEVSVIALSTN